MDGIFLRKKKRGKDGEELEDTNEANQNLWRGWGRGERGVFLF